MISTLMITTTIISLILLQRGNWGLWRGVSNADHGDWGSTATILCTNSQKYPESVVSAANCQVASHLVGSAPSVPDDLRPSPHTLDPNWHQHWENYAAEMRSIGDYQEAVIAQRQAAELAPDRPENYLNLAYLLEWAGDYEEAAEAYTTAIHLNPAVLNSNVFQNSRVKEEIHSELIEYVRSSPEQPLGNALILVAEENYDQAVEELLLLADRFYGNSQYHMLNATAHMGIGNLDQARESLAIAAFSRPQNPEILFTQSQLAILDGDRQLADRLLVQALEEIIFSTQSRRYYFAAYGRATLSVDQVPFAIRGSITPAILEEAQKLRIRTDDPYIHQLVEWITQASGAREDQPLGQDP